MRKIRYLALLLAVLLLPGCRETPPDMASPVRFYYKAVQDEYSAAQSALGYETVDAVGHEADYAWILTRYFSGPQSGDLIAPFQRSTELLSAELNGTQMQILVTESLAELSGMDLTLACACITLTCLELPGVESVSISAQGSQLAGQQALTMSREDLLLEDLGASLISADYILYFSDTDNRYLIGQTIQVDREQENLPAYLVERLIGGPDEAGLAETMPLGTRLLGVEVVDGVCSVNLSAEFLENAPRTDLAQRMTILSLTNTVTQLDGIDALVLNVDGQPLEHYGRMYLAEPLTFESGAVGPARTALNELDADLYLLSGESRLLSSLPVRVRQTASQAAVELVLQALLAYQDQNGYHTPIPAGTTLLSVYQDGTCCTVDLSAEFLTAGENLTLAVRSVCATALAQSESPWVRITVEGATPQGDYGTLFDAQQWQEDWFIQ